MSVSNDLVLGLISVVPILATAGDGPAPADLNARVLEFARDQIGRKVGDGECTSLALEAFREVGARRFPPYGPEADYVWGEYIEEPGDVRPGDVLQFRDAVFKGRRQRVERGRVVVDFWERHFPHHTAIVDEVRDRGRVIVILHQNTGSGDMSEEERKAVRRDTLRMSEMQGGEIWAYRPVAR